LAFVAYEGICRSNDISYKLNKVWIVRVENSDRGLEMSRRKEAFSMFMEYFRALYFANEASYILVNLCCK
jgi:hypothetical protein